MNRLRRIANWLWRTWPFIVLSIIGVIHWGLWRTFPAHADAINKWGSVGAQIVGGLILLFSLSQNLKLFGKGSLWAVFKSWVLGFPWSPKHYTLKVEPGHFKFTGHAPMIFQSGGPKSIEQRVAEVEQQLAALEKIMDEKEHSLLTKLDQLRNETNSRLSEHGTTLSALSDKVKETAVGGLMQQLFGVLLATYGVVVGAM